MISQIQTKTEKTVAQQVAAFDAEVSQAITTDSLGALFDQKAREAATDGERLELIALKSLSTGNHESLLTEFGFDGKKITFEAERFLGKKIVKKSDAPSGQGGGMLDKPPTVTENPFAQDLNDLSAGDAVNFFDTLSAQPQV